MRIHPDTNAVDAAPKRRNQIDPPAEGGATMSAPAQS
jgi:hypothetical protein